MIRQSSIFSLHYNPTNAAMESARPSVARLLIVIIQAFSQLLQALENREAFDGTRMMRGNRRGRVTGNQCNYGFLNAVAKEGAALQRVQRYNIIAHYYFEARDVIIKSTSNHSVLASIISGAVAAGIYALTSIRNIALR